MFQLLDQMEANQITFQQMQVFMKDQAEFFFLVTGNSTSLPMPRAKFVNFARVHVARDLPIAVVDKLFVIFSVSLCRRKCAGIATANTNSQLGES
jgi:hypothetical protein